MRTKPIGDIDKAITLHFLKELVCEINQVGANHVMDVYKTMPDTDRKTIDNMIATYIQFMLFQNPKRSEE